MVNKEELVMIGNICDRAESLNICNKDSRLSLFMDLEVACNTFHMDLNMLLRASNLDFVHDIVGIAANLDRHKVTHKMETTSEDAFNYFVPRCVVNA